MLIQILDAIYSSEFLNWYSFWYIFLTADLVVLIDKWLMLFSPLNSFYPFGWHTKTWPRDRQLSSMEEVWDVNTSYVILFWFWCILLIIYLLVCIYKWLIVLFFSLKKFKKYVWCTHYKTETRAYKS